MSKVDQTQIRRHPFYRFLFINDNVIFSDYLTKKQLNCEINFVIDEILSLNL